MFIQNASQIPTGVAEDGINGPAPRFFWGTVAPDGDATPWMESALGSVYIRSASGSVVMYLKDANNGADADWATVDVTT